MYLFWVYSFVQSQKLGDDIMQVGLQQLESEKSTQSLYICIYAYALGIIILINIHMYAATL